MADDRCNAILSHYGTGAAPLCVLPAGHYVGFHQRAPERIQLQRTKGWRKAEGAIVVSRPSKWGNPFRLGLRGLASPMRDRLACVADFRADLQEAVKGTHDWTYSPAFDVMAGAIDELRGHDLACWCPLSLPCHADVLIELSNA